MKQELHFFEEQTFTQGWIWLILALVAVSLVIAFVAVLNSGEGLTLFIFTGVLPTVIIAGLITRLKLVTKVTATNVAVRFRPLGGRTLAFADIEKAYLRNYNSLSEYGGWGWRMGANGKAYNVKGNQGVQLILKDGEKFLIGSQKAAELELAIHEFMAA